MIKGFHHNWLRAFLLKNKKNKKIPPNLSTRLFRKLQLLDDATCDLDLRSPPGNHFEKLTGHLKGLCSIRINDQYRLVFKWDDERGEADDVDLDNHSYRG